MSHQPNHASSPPLCWILELIPGFGTQGAAPVPLTPDNPRLDQKIPLFHLSSSSPPLGSPSQLLLRALQHQQHLHPRHSRELGKAAIPSQGIQALLDTAILLVTCSHAGVWWQQMASHTREVNIMEWVSSQHFILEFAKVSPCAHTSPAFHHRALQLGIN